MIYVIIIRVKSWTRPTEALLFCPETLHVRIQHNEVLKTPPITHASTISCFGHFVTGTVEVNTKPGLTLPPSVRPTYLYPCHERQTDDWGVMNS